MIGGDDEEEAVVDEPFREVEGSLLWVSNQTRPDVSNEVRNVQGAPTTRR